MDMNEWEYQNHQTKLDIVKQCNDLDPTLSGEDCILEVEQRSGYDAYKAGTEAHKLREWLCEWANTDHKYRNRS